MSALFGFVVFMAYSVIQGLSMVPMLVLHSVHGAPTPKQMTDVMTLGLNLTVATAVGCPAMLVLCAALIRARGGPSITSYLALSPVRGRVLAAWLGGMLVFVLMLSSLNELLERPVPEFIEHSFATAVHLPSFFAAVGICAPVAEEVLFRGFIYRGMAASRLGPMGTILLTSVAFMLVHVGQYDWFDLAQVGLVGIVFGLARWRTGSLLPPIGMHILLNLTSLIMYTAQTQS